MRLFAPRFIDVRGVVDGDVTSWPIRSIDSRTCKRSKATIATRANGRALCEVMDAMRLDLGNTPAVGVNGGVEEFTHRHIVSSTVEVSLGIPIREHRYSDRRGDRPIGVTPRVAAALSCAFLNGIEAGLVLRAEPHPRHADWHGRQAAQATSFPPRTGWHRSTVSVGLALGRTSWAVNE